MTLRHGQLLFNLGNAGVEVIHQVLLLSVLRRPLRLLLHALVILRNLRLQLLDLLLVLMDDFLAEVAAFCKFFFHFFMVLQVLGQVGDD